MMSVLSGQMMVDCVGLVSVHDEMMGIVLLIEECVLLVR